MSACWRCGTTPPDGANFCAQCGAALDGAPTIDPFTDATGDGFVTPSTGGTSRWPILVGAGLIVGLIAFFVALGGGDESGEAAEDATPESVDGTDPFDTDDGVETGPPTTTTTAPPTTPAQVVGDLEIGTLDNVAGFPIGIADVGDSVFVFTTDTPVGYVLSRGDGMRAVEHRADGSWVDHGKVLETNGAVGEVVSGPDGLIAVGHDGEAAPVVWRSTDGRNWTEESLPFDGERAQPRVVASVEGLTVIAGQEADPWTTIVTRVREELGPIADLGNPDWDGEVVNIRGPFGLVLASVPIEDLGFDPNDLFSGPQQPGSFAWIDDGSGWRVDTFTEPLFDVSPGPDGTIIATRFGELGLVTYRFDGSEWTETPVRDTWALTAWRDGYAGHRPDDEIALFDADFNPTATLELPEVRGADVNNMGTGPAGLAVIQSVWTGSSEPPSQRVVVLRDGYTLEAAPSSGALTLERDGETIVRISAWGPPNSVRDYRFDADTETITLTHPDTGEDLTTFSLDELSDLEDAANSGGRRSPRLSLAFTPDGEAWFDQNLVTYVTNAFPQVVHVSTEGIYISAVDWGSNIEPRTVIVHAVPELDQ